MAANKDDPLGLGADAPADYTAEAKKGSDSNKPKNDPNWLDRNIILNKTFPDLAPKAAAAQNASNAETKRVNENMAATGSTGGAEMVPGATVEQQKVNQNVADAGNTAGIPTAAVPVPPVPVPAPEAVAPAAIPTQPVKGITAKGPETVPAPVSPTGKSFDEMYPEQQAAKSIVQQAKDDPAIGDKLLQLAKDTGRSLLELVQGFAKGYSGSDIPLASQVREEEKKAKLQQEHETQINQAQIAASQLEQKTNEDFQQRMIEMQNDYTNRMFAATTQKEKDVVAQGQQFDAGEANKNRSLQLKIAEIMRTPTMWEQAGGLQQAIAQALAGGKVQ